MSDKYEKQVYLAMLAEQCSRYEDMMAFLEDMVKAKSEDLSSDERNLLSIAYKNTISLDRQAIRTLLAYESKEAKKAESPYLDYIKEYKAKVQKELEDLCNKINSTIDANLLPKANTDEAKVFYHKMKGDYCRYIAENVDGDTKKNILTKVLLLIMLLLMLLKTLITKTPSNSVLLLTYLSSIMKSLETKMKLVN